jgi:uncharacterized protein
VTHAREGAQPREGRVDVTVIVLAKAPVPGRCKTRLCPPCTPTQAASVAEAALADTLDVVAATAADRRVLVLDGEPGPWVPAGIEVVRQRGVGLDERLAHAFIDACSDGRPALLVGMDTPQLTPTLVDRALHRLVSDDAPALLGRAEDGGWWAVGLPAPDPEAFVGVPMSTQHTGSIQAARLRARGHRVELLPTLRDVDHWVDALAVARSAPGGRFARRVSDVAARLVA